MRPCVSFSLFYLMAMLLPHLASGKRSGNFKLGPDVNKVLRVGPVKGRVWILDRRKAMVFKGLPYAQPPIGDLRFEPQKVKPWHEIRSAINYAPPCVQFMDFHLNDKYSGENMKRESEDCLYLNVFAPYDEGSNALYPVLVWIHGGSFLAGSADTGIDEEASLRNIVFKNVVLVTINYRLGPFGFLSSSIDNKKGNFGLWDQIAALDWIQENILSMGGDPSRVTIMGESAGGASVSILALSPLTEKLVHQAIIMSGSAAAGWAINRGSKPNWNLKDFVSYLTCSKKVEFDFDDPVFRDNNWDEVRDKDSGCLRLPNSFKCSASDETGMWECLKTQFNMSHPMQRNLIVYKLGVSKAVVDGEVIPYNVSALLQNLPRMPIMTGVAELEWGHKKGQSYGLDYADSIPEEKAKRLVAEIVADGVTDVLSADSLSQTTIDLISNLTYFNYLSRNSAKNSFGLMEFTDSLRRIQSDIEFVSPCHAEATAYANRNASVYLYSFEHIPTGGSIEEEVVEVDFFGQKLDSIKSVKKKTIKSAYHGLDHAYIFTEGYSSNNQIEFTPEDYKLSDHLTTLLTNFVKHGNPNLESVDEKRSWPPFTIENQHYVQIKGGDFAVRDHFYWSNVTFWNQQTPYLSHFVSRDAEDLSGGRTLAEEERTQLVAYRRAWVALWILVALLALVLWIVVICIVAQRCRGSKTPQPYKNVVVSNA